MTSETPIRQLLATMTIYMIKLLLLIYFNPNISYAPVSMTSLESCGLHESQLVTFLFWNAIMHVRDH